LVPMRGVSPCPLALVSIHLMCGSFSTTPNGLREWEKVVRSCFRGLSPAACSSVCICVHMYERLRVS
jgi:hypothetical protein